MLQKPVYKSVPTMRNYEDYVEEYNYTKGWNDAMDYIFPEEKKKRKKEKMKQKFTVISKQSENIEKGCRIKRYI